MKKKIIIISSLVILLSIVLMFIFLNPFLKLKLVGDKNIDLLLNSDYEELGFKATYFGQDITSKVVVSGATDTSKVGNYKIKYTVKKGLTKKSVIRNVIIKDATAPVITLVGESDIKVCPGKNYEEPGYTAIDEYDGDITDKVNITNDNNIITYKIIDSSGNESKITRSINYVDSDSPEITLNGNTSMTLKKGSSYQEEGAKASDNCDGDITNKITTTGSVNTNKLGTYEIKYSVSDESGNTTSKTRTIKVSNTTTGYENIVAGPTYIKGILIVNKKYSIPSSYGKTDSTAYTALTKLQEGARAAGYSAKLVSGYRSYYTQESIYNSYIKRWGQEYTDKVSARPGHSEHQTGLAFDVGVLSSDYAYTPEGKWVTNNCAKYGFIIRYPKGKESITGYNYEPWHIRYVGVEVATYIMQNNITLEEYLGVA